MKNAKTLKIRIKDKHAKLLNAMAREVNMVWNYVNDLSHKVTTRSRLKNETRFLSAFDIHHYTSGFTKCEGVLIGSPTVQAINEEYCTRRKQFKKTKLNWRVSNPKSPKKSLGWIPFKVGSVKYRAGQLKYAGHNFGLWDSFGLSQYEFRSGSFNQDSRGRWYVNIVVYVEVEKSTATKVCGIDLGLKTSATNSDGLNLESKFYRDAQSKLAVAQRANKKSRVKAIHAKIKNSRKDAMQKYSTVLTKKYGAIFVGNVSSKAMVKTKMAKSTLDSGWSMLKTMLEYKSHQAGIVFEEVNEKYSTQTCSSCGVIPSSSPKGRTGLRIREWVCCECGDAHNRDVNAAKNILAAGHCRLAVGIPSL